ncbi:ribosomal protein L13 [Batrachochytrium salamandrivorans]|nr:ribosomal protein L13 [Batrachochytrium salamandrivorans]
MFEKLVVIDGRGHLVGRLASIVAKELLNGQKVVVVRCEELEMSNSIYANRVKFQLFVKKRTATNPKRGPFHETSPAELFKRALRGMLPRKTARGMAAYRRLTAVEGVPAPFDQVKRMVVPGALRVLRLKPGRKFTNVGEFAKTVGWKRLDTLKDLEAKRKVKSAAFYEKKKAADALLVKAKAEAEYSAVKPILAKFGME